MSHGKRGTAPIKLIYRLRSIIQRFFFLSLSLCMKLKSQERTLFSVSGLLRDIDNMIAIYRFMNVGRKNSSVSSTIKVAEELVGWPDGLTGTSLNCCHLIYGQIKLTIIESLKETWIEKMFWSFLINLATWTSIIVLLIKAVVSKASSWLLNTNRSCSGINGFQSLILNKLSWHFLFWEECQIKFKKV